MPTAPTTVSSPAPHPAIYAALYRPCCWRRCSGEQHLLNTADFRLPAYLSAPLRIPGAGGRRTRAITYPRNTTCGLRLVRYNWPSGDLAAWRVPFADGVRQQRDLFSLCSLHLAGSPPVTLDNCAAPPAHHTTFHRPGSAFTLLHVCGVLRAATRLAARRSTTTTAAAACPDSHYRATPTLPCAGLSYTRCSAV